MKISIVVAVAENDAIGNGGNLLWHLPKDMEYFKTITMGHHVVMGRKTYESIPEKFRPLPGRVNIVVTRQKNYAAPGCKVVSSVEEAIEFAEANEETELMIIGGGEIYREVFGMADKIYLTKVHHTFKNADTFFPEITKFRWQPVFRERHFADEKHKYDFEFIILEKKR
jgi:dihydrofolate reductase